MESFEGEAASLLPPCHGTLKKGLYRPGSPALKKPRCTPFSLHGYVLREGRHRKNGHGRHQQTVMTKGEALSFTVSTQGS